MKIIMLIVTISLPLIAKTPPCKPSATQFCNVEYLRNYDGDTITFNIKGVHPLLGQKISVRIKGVDTPELRTKNVCEKAAGIKAKLFVEKFLKQAKVINLINATRGKYFRIVADVIGDGLSLKDLLISQKLAYPYHGGKKLKIDWCKKGTEVRK